MSTFSRQVTRCSESSYSVCFLPLYSAATKRGTHSLRWHAITLLRRTERQEGLCNSVLTAMVAERLVGIEEEAWLMGY